MPATDQATLLSGPNIACYNNLGMQDQQLIKLALLQIIANALNPMAKTDQASLLSDPNIACYRSVGSYPLLELALLQIIANGIGSGGGSGTQLVFTAAAANPNTGGITPANPSLPSIYYQVPSDGSGTNFWTWDTVAQTWNQVSA
jgi:hypothetical protein